SQGTLDLAAPQFIGLSDQTVTGGKPFNYMLHATDADGDALTYSLVGTVPSWLTLDTSVPNAPVLKGTPPLGLTTYTVTVSASDGRGKATTAPLKLTVANSAPNWATLPDVTVPDLAPLQDIVLPAAPDTEGDALTYSIDPALLPPGLSFNPGTLHISGTPTTPGIYVITARVTDSGTPPLHTDRTFVIQVGDKGPIWSATPAPPDAYRNTPYAYTVPGATDPENQALTYRIVSGPSWLTIDPTAHVLGGTPPASVTALGSFPVVLEAQDTNGETSRLSFTMNVANRPPVWTSGTTSVTALAGAPLDFTPPPATDPDGDSIGYFYSNSMIGILTFNGVLSNLVYNTSTGRITGTTPANMVGTFQAQLVAFDSQGAQITRTITINLQNSPPVYVGGIRNGSAPWGEYTTVTIPPSAFSDPNGDLLSLTVPGAIPGIPTNLLTFGGAYFAATPSGGGTLYFRSASQADRDGADYSFTVIA